MADSDESVMLTNQKKAEMRERMRLIEPVSGHYNQENRRTELSYRTTDHVQFAYSVTYGKNLQLSKKVPKKALIFHFQPELNKNTLKLNKVK